MKILTLSLLLALGVNAQVSFEELLDYREWTSSEGKKLEAELVSVTEKHIEIKRKSDGISFKLKPDMLSEEDRTLLENAQENLLKAAKASHSRERSIIIEKELNDKAREKNLATTDSEYHRTRQDITYSLDKLVSELSKLSTWKLAIRFGVFDELKNTAVLSNPSITLSLGSMVLGSGLGSLGDTGGRDKEFLFKTEDGDLFVRVAGNHLSQKGQKIIRGTSRVIAESGKSITVQLAAKNISLERIGASEALVITKFLP